MTEEKSIEELKSENERLRQAYKYIHASRNSVDEELTEAQKELSSLRSELAEKEKELSEQRFENNMVLSRESDLKALCEAADKVIEAYRSQIYNGTDGKKHLKALEVYDQLKNTKP